MNKSVWTVSVRPLDFLAFLPMNASNLANSHT